MEYKGYDVTRNFECENLGKHSLRVMCMGMIKGRRELLEVGEEEVHLKMRLNDNTVQAFSVPDLKIMAIHL